MRSLGGHCWRPLEAKYGTKLDLTNMFIYYYFSIHYPTHVFINIYLCIQYDITCIVHNLGSILGVVYKIKVLDFLQDEKFFTIGFWK